MLFFQNYQQDTTASEQLPLYLLSILKKVHSAVGERQTNELNFFV